MPKVAQLLSVTERYVYMLIERGELRSVKIGARRLVHHEDLTAFVEQLRTEEASARAATQRNARTAQHREESQAPSSGTAEPPGHDRRG